MKIGPLRIYRIAALRLTVVQWRDVSTTERPMFGRHYHLIDWLVQNHGWLKGVPVGFQVWR